jgi:hypothetical protein
MPLPLVYFLHFFSSLDYPSMDLNRVAQQYKAHTQTQRVPVMRFLLIHGNKLNKSTTLPRFISINNEFSSSKLHYSCLHLPLSPIPSSYARFLNTQPDMNLRRNNRYNLGYL